MSRRSRSFNAFEQATTAAIDDAVTSIPLDSVANLTPPGYLVIDPDNPLLREYIFYTEINALVLDNVSRGLEGSAGGIAQEHGSGARVRAVSVHQWLDDIFDDLDDLTDGTTLIDAYLQIGGGNAMAANLDMGGGGFRVVDMGNPLADQDAMTLKHGDTTYIPFTGTASPTTVMPLAALLEWGDDTNSIQFDATNNFIVKRQDVLRMTVTDTDTFFRSPNDTTQIRIQDDQLNFGASVTMDPDKSIYWGAFAGNERILVNATKDWLIYQGGDPRLAITPNDTWLRTPDGTTAFILNDARTSFLSPAVRFPDGSVAAPGIAFNGATNRGIRSSGATMNLVVDAVDMVVISSSWLRFPSIYSETTGTAANVTIDSSGQMKRFVASSKRYKTNIVDLDYGPGQLRPRQYNYKPGVVSDDPEGLRDHWFFIAEEVYDEFGEQAIERNEDGDVDNVNLRAVVAILASKINALEDA